MPVVENEDPANNADSATPRLTTPPLRPVYGPTNGKLVIKLTLKRKNHTTTAEDYEEYAQKRAKEHSPLSTALKRSQPTTSPDPISTSPATAVPTPQAQAQTQSHPPSEDQRITAEDIWHEARGRRITAELERLYPNGTWDWNIAREYREMDLLLNPMPDFSRQVLAPRALAPAPAPRHRNLRRTASPDLSLNDNVAVTGSNLSLADRFRAWERYDIQDRVEGASTSVYRRASESVVAKPVVLDEDEETDSDATVPEIWEES